MNDCHYFGRTYFNENSGEEGAFYLLNDKCKVMSVT
jgi:hypothetical protein